jgi:hypothetical protein
MDANVRHMQVQQITKFDGRGNPEKHVQYSYFLGANGPFTDDYKDGEDSPDVVNAGVAARVAKLQAVGALPTPGV